MSKKEILITLDSNDYEIIEFCRDFEKPPFEVEELYALIAKLYRMLEQAPQDQVGTITAMLREQDDRYRKDELLPKETSMIMAMAYRNAAEMINDFYGRPLDA